MRNFVKKQCVHISLMSETHAGLKLQSCNLHMSIQSIIEELTQLVVQRDPYIITHLKNVVKRRRENELVALYNTDAESMLDNIEMANSVKIKLDKQK